MAGQVVFLFGELHNKPCKRTVQVCVANIGHSLDKLQAPGVTGTWTRSGRSRARRGNVLRTRIPDFESLPCFPLSVGGMSHGD